MSYPLLNAFLTMMWFFLWVVWIYLVFVVIFDVIRSPDLSGWVKTGWVALTVLLPFFGVLVYLIARGGSMHERQSNRTEAEAYRAYQRTASGNGHASESSRASEIGRLADLRDRSVITEEEFQQGKAKVLN